MRVLRCAICTCTGLISEASTSCSGLSWVLSLCLTKCVHLWPQSSWSLIAYYQKYNSSSWIRDHSADIWNKWKLTRAYLWTLCRICSICVRYLASSFTRRWAHSIRSSPSVKSSICSSNRLNGAVLIYPARSVSFLRDLVISSQINTLPLMNIQSRNHPWTTYHIWKGTKLDSHRY